MCLTSCHRDHPGGTVAWQQQDFSGKADSLETLAWHYYPDKPDSSEIILCSTIRFLDSVKQPQLKLDATMRLAEFYQYRKPDYLKAIRNLLAAVRIFTESPGQYETNPYFFIDIGNIFYRSRFYRQAQNFYQISFHTTLRDIDFHARALALQNIALCFQDQGKYDSALTYFNRADGVISDRHHLMMAQNDADKAALFLQCGRYDSAASLAFKSLAILDQSRASRPDQPPGQEVRFFLSWHETAAKANEVLSGYFACRNQPDSSLARFEKALTGAGTARSISLKADLFLQRVICGREEHKKHAGAYADSAMSQAWKLRDPMLAKSFSDSLSAYFSRNKMQALHDKYNHLSLQLADSIYRMKASGELAESVMLLSSVATEQAFHNLDDLRVNNGKSVRQQNIILISFFLFFFLVIPSIHLFALRKRKSNLPAYSHAADLPSDIDIEDRSDDMPHLAGHETFVRLTADLEALMIHQKPYLNKSITLAHLAKILNTNQTYLSQVIHQQYGLKFNDFINEFRVKEACRLLQSDNSCTISIEHLSERSGFNSKSTFYCAFRKVTGKSPATFEKTAILS